MEAMPVARPLFHQKQKSIRMLLCRKRVKSGCERMRRKAVLFDHLVGAGDQIAI